MNQAKSLYKPFFRWAKRRGLARRNPMADFELPTSTQVPVERTPPEVEEMCTLLDTAVEVVPDIAPILALGAVTGMRRGELVSVRRSRLDPARNQVTVDVAASGHTLKHTKTRRVRTFHVDDATMAMLIDLCEKQDDAALHAGLTLDPDPFLFTAEPNASKPLAPDALTKRVAVLKRARDHAPSPRAAPRHPHRSAVREQRPPTDHRSARPDIADACAARWQGGRSMSIEGDQAADSEVLIVEEAAAVLRISRNAAYAATQEWRATGGATGLPCITIGRTLRVPRSGLNRMMSVGSE